MARSRCSWSITESSSNTSHNLKRDGGRKRAGKVGLFPIIILITSQEVHLLTVLLAIILIPEPAGSVGVCGLVELLSLSLEMDRQTLFQIQKHFRSQVLAIQVCDRIQEQSQERLCVRVVTGRERGRMDKFGSILIQRGVERGQNIPKEDWRISGVE
jgi:hypothetical protein